MSTDTAVAKPVDAVKPIEGKAPEAVFSLAPVPVESAWGSVVTEIPITQITLDNKNKKRGTPSIKPTSSDKWVPVKASIVIGGPKKSTNGRKSSKSSKSSNANGTKSNSASKKKKQTKTQNNKSTNDTQSNDAFRKSGNDENRKPNQQQYNGSGFQKRKNYSKNTTQPRQQASYHMPRQYNNQNFQPQYSMQPIIMAVNNVARQFEYYFSVENLAKDEFLKSKLSKDGYASVASIAKFFRIVNLSFGGDISIILAALREIVANEGATVEIATGKKETEQSEEATILSNYFIRSKEWTNSIPEEITTVVSIGSTLGSNALDEFMISAAPVDAQITESTEQDVPLTPTEEASS